MTRQVNPFSKIYRGEDSVGQDDEVVFSDFSPKVVPSSGQDESEEALDLPKGGSAPGLVVSPESLPASEVSSEKIAQNDSKELAVALEDGTPSPTESSNQDSSSKTKTG